MNKIWILKALLQKTLARIPFGVRLNYFLQLLLSRHSHATIALRASRLAGYLASVNQSVPLNGKVVLEVGAGWTCIHSLLISLMGAKQVIAVDYYRHVRFSVIRKVILAINSDVDKISKALSIDQIKLKEIINQWLGANSIEEVFRLARISYCAPFDIISNKNNLGPVDIVYSYAVMAHVPAELLDKFNESIAKLVFPNGYVVHRIGLEDPYNEWNGGSNINFLRFSNKCWNTFFQSEIQYNNRLRASQHIKSIENSGVKLVSIERTVDQKSIDLLPFTDLDEAFKSFDSTDIATVSINLIGKVIANKD